MTVDSDILNSNLRDITFPTSGNSKDNSLLSRCSTALSHTMRSAGKMEDRKTLLEKSPESRQSINTRKLKQVIDYVDFKCHPECSIARDEAVQGSDIDGGLVVLSERVGVDRELEFVQELRNQGFEASHKTEVEAAQNQVEAAKSRISAASKEFRELKDKEVSTHSSEIRFYTKTELEAMEFEPLDNLVIIYVAGHSIQ